MSQQDSYQSINTFALKPVYISLGLPKSTFGVSEETTSACPFVTALDGGTKYPDCAWLFRGEDCYRFNVKTGEFEAGPIRLSDAWGGTSWPLLFSSGVDSAVWLGPIDPDHFIFFKDNLYIRYRASSGQIDGAPRPIEWDFGSAGDYWLAKGPGVPLHAIETRYQGMLHFFKGSEYFRRDLNAGVGDAGPMPITEQWQLPEFFAKDIDLAFYGTGDEAAKIYFFKGQQCLLYNTKTHRADRVTTIEERFPAMAKFIARPQIFLVENYELNSYVGPTEAGEVVDTKSIPAGSKKSFIMVTEVTETSSTAINQSILQSQDATVENNFYDQMKSQNEQSGSREKYDYQFDASFHGDASATGLASYEANANLKARGGTNDVRNGFVQAVAGTIESQLKTTSKQINQKVYTSKEEITRTEHIMRREEEKIENDSDQTRVYEFRLQRQPHLTLIVLRRVQLAFTDGQRPPEVVDISRMDSLLTKYIPMQKDRDDVRQVITGETMTVSDYQGTPTQVIKEASLSGPSGGQSGRTIYQFDPRLKSNYTLTNPDGSEQVIAVEGLVKGDHRWLVPTYTIIAVEKS